MGEIGARRLGLGRRDLPQGRAAACGHGRTGQAPTTAHDQRRTFVKLTRLGCASIQNPERYLGLRQNLHDTPRDRLGVRGWEEEA